MTAPKAHAAAALSPDVSNWTKFGRNVRTQLIDGMLFVAIDTSKTAYQNVTPTAKGNATIASTLGNVAIEGTTLKMGLNIYGPPPVA